jgi:hypothetical protein
MISTEDSEDNSRAPLLSLAGFEEVLSKLHEADSVARGRGGNLLVSHWSI